METLLRQKDCKSKHNFLITKQLTQENRGNKQEKKGSDLGANGLGIIRLCNSCYSLYFVLATIRAKLGLALIYWQEKKT